MPIQPNLCFVAMPFLPDCCEVANMNNRYNLQTLINADRAEYAAGLPVILRGSRAHQITATP
jgi:hypothetical protein